MVTALDTEELTHLNRSYFNDLITSIKELGYNLSSADVQELRSFYERGAAKLRLTADDENYADLLSYATGQLVNQFAFSDPSQVAAFGSFRDFLHSFCPLDPWC